MASCKVKWILAVLALAGCISTSTAVVNDNNFRGVVPTTIEDLIVMLREAPLEPKDVEHLLNLYGDRDGSIYDNTVGELTELCRVSLDKCTLDKLQFITERTEKYEQLEINVTALGAYGRYCRYTKLASYCLENIAQVTENLLNSVSKEDKELVWPFLEKIQQEGFAERAYQLELALVPFQEKADAYGEMMAEDKKADYAKYPTDDEYALRARERDVNSVRFRASSHYFEVNARKVLKQKEKLNEDLFKAYSSYAREKLGSAEEVSVEQEELFLHKFVPATKPYSDMYGFFLNLGNKPLIDSTLKTDAQIDLFKLGLIANRFYRDVSVIILWELQARIEKKYRTDQFSRIWFNFFSNTSEADILKDQADRKAALAANPPGKFAWLQDFLAPNVGYRGIRYTKYA